MTALAVSQGQPQRAQAGATAGDGRIVFVATTNRRPFSSFDIASINPDGSDFQRLTNGGRHDNTSPSISPDGSEIAFTGGRTGTSQIYEMKVDGSSRHRITDAPLGAYDPSYSPDGTRIAFSREVRHGYTDIFVMNADGSAEHRVIRLPAGNDYAPTFSPDGETLAFERG
jgi:TolB protein